MVQSTLSSGQPAVPIKLPAVTEHFKQQPIVVRLEYCQEMGVFMRERKLFSECPPTPQANETSLLRALASVRPFPFFLGLKPTSKPPPSKMSPDGTGEPCKSRRADQVSGSL